MSYTGRGEIFIYSYSNSNINGKAYKKGELITYLNDAEFQVQFTVKDAQVQSQKINRLSSSEVKPNVAAITADGFKKAVWNFIGVDLKKNVAYKPVFETIDTDENGSAYLNTVGHIQNIIIYEMDTRSKQQGYTLDEYNKITNLTPDKVFYIYYEKEMQISNSYKFATPTTNYFTIKFVQANRILEIPKAGFISAPNLRFEAENFINIPLEFMILNGEVNIYES